jgi:hypothetical protein
LELTHDDVKYLLDSLKKREEVIQRIESRQQQSQPEPRRDKDGNIMVPIDTLPTGEWDISGAAKQLLSLIHSEPKPFKLEYSKSYKSRNGVIYGPLVKNVGHYRESHPFYFDSFSWRENGYSGLYYGTPSNLDLIEEVI